jgi:hypothetical protein
MALREHPKAKGWIELQDGTLENRRAGPWLIERAFRDVRAEIEG